MVNQPTSANPFKGTLDSYNVSSDVTDRGSLFGMDATSFIGVFYNYLDNQSYTFNKTPAGRNGFGSLSQTVFGDVRNFGVRAREELNLTDTLQLIAGIGYERSIIDVRQTGYVYPLKRQSGAQSNTCASPLHERGTGGRAVLASNWRLAPAWPRRHWLRHPDRADAVDDLASNDIATLRGDASDEDVARRTMALAIERFGRLDILVNNAGRTLNAPLVETTVADFDAILAVNARGNFVHAREAMKVMQDHGAIVAVASISSVVGFKTQAAYASSKGAIAQLTKVIAMEGGERGIRANAVAPGVIETDIMEGVVEGDGRAMLRSFAASAPDWPHRAARGSGRGDCLSGFPSRKLHHRRNPHGRWRVDSPIGRDGNRCIWRDDTLDLFDLCSVL